MDIDDKSRRPPSRSAIPVRPQSKLPLPRSIQAPSTRTLRPAASSDKLSELRVPRLRNSPSRDTLQPTQSNAPKSSIPPPRYISTPIGRQLVRDTSTSTVIHTPSKTPTAKKSYPVLRSRASYGDFGRPAPETVSVETTSAIETGDHNGSEGDNRSVNAKRARPSLSERTIETLAQLPPSPAVKSRGTSAGSMNGSSPFKEAMLPPISRMSSRPSSRPTSSSSQKSETALHTLSSAKSNKLPVNTPTRPTTNKSLGTPSTVSSVKSSFSSIRRQSKLVSPGFGAQRRSPSPVKIEVLPTIKSGSKTVTSRTLKPRASVTGLFRKPSMPNLERQAQSKDTDYFNSKPSPTFSNTSSESTKSRDSRPVSASSASTVKENEAQTTKVPKALPKASLALRDQIAKAKAAKRALGQVQAQEHASKGPAPAAKSLVQKKSEVSVVPADAFSFDFGPSDDPFNQAKGEGGNKGLLRKRVESARRDGRLNIAAMGLKEVPSEVMNMYDMESMGSGSWAETVDLKRFVAADNEFETLGDDVFPDVDPRESMDDEDSKGNQFAGVEALDLHGNLLISLPMGLRRLEFLTSLNLSNNKLQMDCFDVLSQIPSLKDLRLNNCMLNGSLSDQMSKLSNLEALYLQKNKLSSLPDGLASLVRLRILDISENMFVTIPFGILQTLPIKELLASKNKLAGVLMDEQVTELGNLQVLDVTANSLVRLCAPYQVSLPAIHQLNSGANRLTALPDITSWTSLITLIADGNSISDLPQGLVTLEKLKIVDLSGNNIKSLDDRIGLMASLDNFKISGNPLREKKFSGMSTEDLKRALKSRLAPPELEEEDDIPQTDGTSSPVPTSPNPPSSPWPVKTGGILDRSTTQSYSLNPVIAAQVASDNTIRTLELHHNLFREIPSSVAFFANTLTSLNLSHNELTSDTFLKDGLDLPFLKELNLSSNTFSSLLPLTTLLFAPNLESLDISFNRLTSLPILRGHFPKLRIINASNNTIRDLNPDAVKGLRILDCSSNELNGLPARLGLLGGPGGLERLDVRGNRFRVPRWEVLEKGTEAVLAWLRDRIPNHELSDSGETF